MSKIKPLSLWASTTVVINEVSRSRFVEELDWEGLVGHPVWSIHADYNGFTRCLVYVEESKHAARFSDTRNLVRSWLCRLEREGRLVAEVDGSEVHTPYLFVERAPMNVA
jgi:hypothetical protein